jgi:hypothetical protein
VQDFQSHQPSPSQHGFAIITATHIWRIYILLLPAPTLAQGCRAFYALQRSLINLSPLKQTGRLDLTLSVTMLTTKQEMGF